MSQDPKNDHPNKLTLKDEPEVYRFLYTHYLHQDKLSWSRTQALGVVELAVLTAAHATKGCRAVIVLLFGSLIVWLIWRLIKRDWEVRDQHLSKMDDIHKSFAIEVRTHPECCLFRGKKILSCIVNLLLFANALLMAWYFWPCLSTVLQSLCICSTHA